MTTKAAAVALMLLGSCTTGSPEANPTEQPSPAVKAQSTEAPPTWAPPDRYSFELKSSCGERSLIGRFHVEVTDGDVSSIQAMDQRARDFMRYIKDSGEQVPALDELLDEAATARSDGADIVEVAVDPTDGHPTSIDIDYNEQAIDDEACYVISDYVEQFDCDDLCISDVTVTTGQEVTIIFAPPRKQIWGVEAELRPLGKKRIGWLYGYSRNKSLKTLWPRPNLGFRSIGFHGRAAWSWTIPNRLEPGVYEIRKDSIRQGSAPVEERTEIWTVSFEVTN